MTPHKTAYTLYTAATPNGQKPAILLEELGVPYQSVVVNLGSGDQKQPDYLRKNPNGKIPTLIDHEAGDFSVFESAAILFYLAEKTGRFLPRDAKGRSEVMQWVMFHASGTGPMLAQAGVWQHFMKEKYAPGIERYQNEGKRLLKVLDQRLADREYLCGEYSIADIAHFTWINVHAWTGVTLDETPAVKAWVDRVLARPAVQRGLGAGKAG